ncbi:MAG TPA: phytoene/squalene synthase family protein [Candidatus Dormibacteraeota bacterium]|nr:phytoene/squalene synthase family protein [Candidatus Dormibacteraeota bacterium]
MAGSIEASYAHCHQVARRAARNFYYGFLLLPAPKRMALCAVYAYMRQVDDLADTPGDVETKRRMLETWRASTERALRGEPGREPLWPALLDAIERYRIPPRYLLDVVAGAGMDLENAVYRTFGELRRYCYHVAGAVGLVCLYIFGFSDARAPELAEQMGIAFQLTNILRDIGQDYRMGRVYLPEEDLRRFGCDARDFMRNTAPDGPLAGMLEFEANRAWEFYRQAWALVPLVSEDSRRALWALARIYSGLLEEIERRRFDVFSARPRLSAAEKIAILLWARLGPAGTYEFRQRDRSWRGLGWALLRHRAR